MSNLWGKKTPEDIAAAKLRQRFIRDGFRLKKRETEDRPCPKCGYASLVRATYRIALDRLASPSELPLFSETVVQRELFEK